MGGKRKNEDKEDRIRRKIARLEEKLRRNYDRRSIECSDEELGNSASMPDLDFDDEPQAETLVSHPTKAVETQHSASSPFQGNEPTVQSPEGCAPPQPLELTTSNNVDSENVDVPLNSDILTLLGDAPKNDTPLGNPIHKDIASRWQEILAKGLQKEIKEKILSEYTIPSNCDLLIPPTLNPEAKAALAEPQIKRDFSLMLKQKQIGIAISALTRVTELIINQETSAEKLLKPISDACRLLCDSHYTDTRTRRNFITSVVDAGLKDTLLESARDRYLFGENIGEKLKNAKTIQRSGQSLITKKSTITHNKNYNPKPFRLNFKALHRKPATNPDAGRYRSPVIPSTSSAGQRQPKRSFNRQQQAERSPPPPATRRPYRK